jgi:TPR repeat protein
MYDTGEGVAQDYAEAIKWYRLAAAQGYARAQANLGLMYLDGQGVAKNLNEAERLLRLATDQNLVGAVALLVEVQRQLAQAQTVAPMSVEDFLLDTKELDGHVIAVHGVAMCMGADLCFLYPGPMQVNQGVAFEPTGLPREDRRKLLDCNLFLKNCPLTVIGRVSADAMIAKLIARQVEW